MGCGYQPSDSRAYDNKLSIAKDTDKDHVANLGPLPRIPAPTTPSLGPQSRHVRHLEATPGEDAHHSDDELKNVVCESRLDSHRSLHQIQLLAIRDFKFTYFIIGESVESSNLDEGIMVDGLDSLSTGLKGHREGKQNVVIKPSLKDMKERKVDSVGKERSANQCHRFA
ncbi:unnamed protein product [Hydatigera taeniaeformis]|uniref:Uncharacterized protein n=1 Tax=Hydatigena taeniaeformis TaxID=6205 RepID=A0A0R3X2X1_HYDTA|nr:unnamed protein product [Hydatigera taeniaeformis]